MTDVTLPVDADIRPGVGTLTAGGQFVVPLGFKLRVYLGGVAATFAVADRYQGSIAAFTPLGELVGMPYWNGTAVVLVNVTVMPDHVDFDGRTYAFVLCSAALPYALLPLDAT